MRITLQGYEARTWTDKGTGEVVKGIDLHYTFNHMRVAGLAVTRKFISDHTQRPELIPGRDYILEYDEKGRPIQFYLADDMPTGKGTK